ncbi:MAG: 1-(5-phosphoribosyl)-5-[(5-phosphoribosylamino)methylideneamino] imidazole-4-carboxamide isomerase [Cyclobacteriaceae bacterium]|nr:1-(5-phosphoribosyl)-5-[(5-phosphoribosylamino)methylideneamino] imidazole-4-carboxamide isomerase [Cyclobacteriaceae bacterium]
MIHLIPSITVMKGKTTRLTPGEFSKEKVYDQSPLELAMQFEAAGVSQIHLVDLEGARRGSSVNYQVLEAICGHTNLKVSFSGGISTDGDISKAYEYGAHNIIAATIAAYRPEYFASWIMSYGRERIVLGADSIQGKIAIRGWQKDTAIDLFEHIEYFFNRGLKYVKTTDISKHGAMSGPSLELYKEILERFPGICLLASGGVRSVEDIEQLQELGVWGVVFGKAFYEGVLTLKDLEKFLISV